MKCGLRRWLAAALSLGGLGMLGAAAAAAPTAPAYELLKGEWQQGAVLIGKTDPKAVVEFDGRRLRLTPDGLFVFGLDRDAAATATLSLRLPGQPAVREQHEVAHYDWPVQRIDGLPPAKVNPPATAMARIKKEYAALHAAREPDTALAGFAQNWQWPVQGVVSGAFGRQRVLNGEAKQPHMGMDIAVPTGTAVKSPAAGIVRLAAKDLYFTGGTLVIDHGHGLFSIFAHLSALKTSVGAQVQQGQTVALSGATGRATGPHLHWGVYWFESHVDPQRLVPAGG